MTYHIDESDYVPLLDVTLGFPADPFLNVGSTVCQSVSIIGDDVMEGDESFTVVATPEANIDVFLGSNTVTITIPNGDDGKCSLNHKLSLFSSHNYYVQSLYVNSCRRKRESLGKRLG